MNLIEQLGGYEEAKKFINGECADGFDVQSLRNALLEYRREHNIFKVGDLIVYHSIKSHKNLFSVRYVGGDSITVYECLDEMGAKTFSEFKPYLDIRHATPEEIQAGKKL